MANRMVLFANFIALAEEQGHRVMNPTFHSYAALFETTRRDIYCEYPAPVRRSWMDIVPGVTGAIRSTRLFFRIARPASLVNERVRIFGRRVITLRQTPGQEITMLEGPEVQAKIRDAGIVLVNGWNFRAPGLVRRHADKIRGYFQPTHEFQEASRLAVERLRQDADVVIGVHIRRGDFSRLKDGRYFFPVSRYASWMKELADQFPARKVAFLVCSDEPRERNEFPGLSVGLGAGSAVADLDALARCDYIFGPVSTFSQWASFYGNKPLFQIYESETRLQLARFCVSDLREIP